MIVFGSNHFVFSGYNGKQCFPPFVCADDNGNWLDIGKNHNDSALEGNRGFTLQGQVKDHNTIFLKLRIADASGY